MNANAITARLDDYDKVRSNKEAIDFKKNLDTKLSLRDKRELAKTFFNNSGMISNLKKVDIAIKSISENEKLFKKNLKKEIAIEEYYKAEKTAKKSSSRHPDVMNPYDSFNSNHHSYETFQMTRFKCVICENKFDSEHNAIKHKQNERRKYWLEYLNAKILKDKRYIDWLEAPADIKHLTVKASLPDPVIDLNHDDVEEDNSEINLNDAFVSDDDDVTLVPEDRLQHQDRRDVHCTPSTSLSGKVPEISKKEYVRLSAIQRTKHKEEQKKKIDRVVRNKVRRIQKPGKETVEVIALD